MTRLSPRRILSARLVALAILGLLGLTATAAAQEPKPQRKDTSERLRPKEVVLTAKVGPEKAKPGDKVTYTVTAKVESPWHIYKYDAAQPDEGPRLTQFDFFRLDGLKPASEPAGNLSWKAAKPPIRKKEPAFPNLPAVEFYENEASWSVELTVPPGTAAGVKTLQSQVYFQICNDQVCKPPVYVTVPPATLTIGGGAGPSASLGATAPLPLIGLAVPAAVEAQPARKDTNPKLRPQGVALRAAVEPAGAAPGQTVTYKVTAKIDAPWHVYAYRKPGGSDDGPVATEFDFFDRGGLDVAGDWTPSKPPIVEKSAAFAGVPFVEYHKDEITWSVALKVPNDAKAGVKIPLKCQVHFQICDESRCLPPVYWTPDEAVLTVASPAAALPAAVIGGLTIGLQAPAAAEPAAATVPEAPSKSAPLAGSAAQEKIDQGLLPFLGWSALGGVFALLMPCVWPMIPVTVNFFVKQGQGQQGKGKTTGLAITYCLAIIGIFTLVGLLFSAFFGASALTRLANNPWLNVGVGLLFVVFGLSLLGLFEISLPSGLLNASAKGEGRGGLIGVMFMALTLTITSFTCTFPVVGALVVMAARGNYLYPVLGLATFATVLALPFFLLALSPGLLKQMPRSGDWMNVVKVIGGLVEIGAAFKFLNTAEIGFGTTPEDCWLDSGVLLAVWVVLCLICGLYLLGLFKTDHDYDEVKVGASRMLGGAAFLALGLYLAPALFGYPPQGQIYTRLVVGILPADSDRLNSIERTAQLILDRMPTATTVQMAGDDGPAQAAPARAVKATSTDPDVAVREEIRVHNGIAWGLSYDAALEQAKAQNRPVLIDFTGVNCANCRLMEQKVFPKAEVVALMKRFVTAQLYTDYVPIASLSKLHQEELAEANSGREIDLADEQTMPLYVIVTPDGRVVAKVGGYVEPDAFAKFLRDGLDAASGDRVARADAATGR